MNKRLFSILMLIVFTACSVQPQPTPTAEPIQTTTPVSELPTPVVQITKVPDATVSATIFLQCWKDHDYLTMFELTSSTTKSQLNADNFALRYQEAETGMTLRDIDFSLGAPTTLSTSVSYPFHITYHTNAVGDIERDMVMNMVLEGGVWTVEWDDGLILPELKGGNKLAMDVTVPARGNIFDKDGDPLASQQTAFAISVVPTQLGDGMSAALSGISGLTGQPIPWLAQTINDNRDAYWNIPMGEAPAELVNQSYSWLSGVSGVALTEYTARYYPNNGIASHSIGYVGPIPAESLEEYKRLGYRQDERMGKAGLEKWADDILSGTRGASLVVVDPNGQVISRLAKKDSLPAKSITTTLDADLQLGAQQALGGFRGAIVVIEVETGKIRAMASTPDFDPNAYDFVNPNSQGLIADTLANPSQPLLNRASQGGYPLGSVFKIITMAAALESGLYTKESKLDCTHTFTELPGVTLYDWTFQRELPPSGMLTLPEGLMRSCNIWFYHIGLDLYRQNRPDDITNMAKGFGLGTDTGIGAVPEITGSIPAPVNEDDATQQGIGQGAMLVTPLQVANFIAAIANDGVMLKPQIIENVIGADGTVIQEYKVEEKSTLPVSAENLKIIQDAMFEVIRNERGTARRLSYTGLRLYGKTGTATNPFGKPHAWFAGYSDQNGSKPDIAVVVLAENAGEGSEMAVPIFRRIMEIYFRGRPQTIYPWESEYNVTRTPTPVQTETPQASP